MKVKKKIKARSISSIRKAEFSKAAFEAVIKYGLRGTTLEKVGEIAGVSKGVVLHHFKDKSSLLEAVFRRSNAVLSKSFVELVRYAESPYDRLWAIAYANFSTSIYNKEVCQAWVTLLAEVPHNNTCQRIQYVNNQRIKSNLKHELKHFLDSQKADETANILSILIDGIWVRAGLFMQIPDSEKALDEFEFTIINLMAATDEQRKQHKLARDNIKKVAEIALNSRFIQH